MNSDFFHDFFHRPLPGAEGLQASAPDEPFDPDARRPIYVPKARVQAATVRVNPKPPAPKATPATPVRGPVTYGMPLT